MLAFSIITVVLDIILGVNAILMFANLRTKADIQSRMINLLSSVLFMVLEAIKLLIEIFIGKAFIVSSIIVAVYFVIIIITMYNIIKKNV